MLTLDSHWILAVLSRLVISIFLLVVYINWFTSELVLFASESGIFYSLMKSWLPALPVPLGITLIVRCRLLCFFNLKFISGSWQESELLIIYLSLRVSLTFKRNASFRYSKLVTSSLSSPLDLASSVLSNASPDFGNLLEYTSFKLSRDD